MKPPLTAAEKEARGQTLLFGLGAAVTLAGVVLLVGLVFDLGPALLTYCFALGLGVVTLVLGFRTGSKQVLAPLTIASGIIGGGAAASGAELGQFDPLVGAVLGTAVVALCVWIGRRWEMPSVGVWIAWALVFVHFLGLSSYSVLLAAILCLIGTLGRPWPTQQAAIALAAALMLFVNYERPALAVYILFALTVAAGIVVVNLVRAVPAPRPVAPVHAGPLPVVPANSEVGAQPWHLHSIILTGAWVGSLANPQLVNWLTLLVAGAACLIAIAMPEPAGAVRPPQVDHREVLVALGVCLLALALTIGRVDSTVEHYVVILLAIALQVRSFVGPRLGWVVRGIPALLAFFATIETSAAIWAFPEWFVDRPDHLVNVGLLTLLGIALMVFRHNKPNPVLDGMRFVLGLYLACYAIVAGAALLGDLLGDLRGGFLIGHAAASVLWMSFAVWIALRRGSRNPAADLTVAAVIAIAATGKLIAFDMQTLGGIPRVLVFLLCGGMMLLIAFERQKRASAARAAQQPSQPPTWVLQQEATAQAAQQWGQQPYPQPPSGWQHSPPPPGPRQQPPATGQQQYPEPSPNQGYGPEGDPRVER